MVKLLLFNQLLKLRFKENKKQLVISKIAEETNLLNLDSCIISIIDREKKEFRFKLF
jgi:hypothetical protein